MKILLVNDIGRPTGGAELQMLALRQGLRDRALKEFSEDKRNDRFLEIYRQLQDK
ncbi:MAG: hypothetical protein AB4368_18020 [Xenococcaceae cyanobacterium]